MKIKNKDGGVIDYERFRLKNGTRVIIAPVSHTRIVNIKIYAEIGSRYENKTNNGITHLVEHMMFKGTKRRPNDTAISREAEDMGAVLNGSTSRHFCCIYSTSLDEYFGNCMDILADLFHNSKYGEKEISAERGSIIEEIKMHKDIPSHRASEMLDGLLYGTNPLAMPLAGTESTLRSMNRGKLRDFVRKHFTPSNIIISIAGRADPSKARKLIEKYFGSAERGIKNRYRPFAENQKKPALAIEKKETQQTTLDLGVRSCSYGHADYYATSLLSIILGGGGSSRLYTALRSKLGLVYSVYAANMSYRDTGSFYVAAGCSHGESLKVIKIILSQMQKLREKNVTAAELKRVKNGLRSAMYMLLDKSTGIADYLVNEEITRGSIMTPEEKLELINKVTADDIRRISNGIFKTSKLNLAAVGALDEARLRTILKI